MLFEVLNLHPLNFLLPVGALVLLLASLGIYHHPHLRGFSLLCLFFASIAILDGFAETRLTSISYLLTPLFAMTLGPLLYLFTRNLVYGEGGLTLPHLAHFLPALVAFVGLPTTSSAAVPGLASVFLYGVLAIRLLRKYHHAAFASHGDADAAKLSWSYPIIVCLSGAFVFELTLGHLQYGLFKDLTISNVLMVTLMLCGCVYLVFNIQRQPLILTDLNDYFSIRDASSVNIDKDYRQQNKVIFKQVEKLMRDKRLYQEPSLSLRDLAATTGFDPQQLTLAITQGFGGSFCDYINEYRVKALKKTLRTAASTEELWRLAMAEGFRTRSAVLGAVKRITGKDPKKYLKTHQV